MYWKFIVTTTTREKKTVKNPKKIVFFWHGIPIMPTMLIVSIFLLEKCFNEWFIDKKKNKKKKKIKKLLKNYLKDNKTQQQN